MNQLISISNSDLVILCVIMLLNGLLSWFLSLGLEKKFFISSVRTVVQLLLLGLVIGTIFNLKNPWPVLGLAILMTLVAAWTSGKRVEFPHSKQLLVSILGMITSVWPVLFVVLLILSPEPWYRPQYLIPLCGMLLGNSINAISLGVDRFQTDIKDNWQRIVSDLSLGATLTQAIHPSLKKALVTGLTPILNTMAIAGLVSLPGMMTGQILAGADPWEASKYQVMIMILICTTCFLGGLVSIYLSSLVVFKNHQRDFLSWARS